jgi:hypothetical protein
VTCRRPLGILPTIPLSLKERLEGVKVTLQVADMSERCALIRHFSGHQTLSSEVIDWMAARVAGNLRTLRVCALQLASIQVESRGQVDVARARVVLEEAALLVADRLPGSGGEILPPSRRISGVFAQSDDAMARKTRFKQMLTEAETDDEKRLALEIALGERLRELRGENATDERRTRFERALGLLRCGNLEEALKYIA